MDMAWHESESATAKSICLSVCLSVSGATREGRQPLTGNGERGGQIRLGSSDLDVEWLEERVLDAFSDAVGGEKGARARAG